MIRLVGRLSAELEPQLPKFRLRDLGGLGTHSSSVEDWTHDWLAGSRLWLNWRVSTGGSVYLHCGLEQAEDSETKIRRGYLLQHLRSSLCSWLVEDEEKGVKAWGRFGGEELKCRDRLLRNIDRAVERLTDRPLADAHQMSLPGPSTWFSDSIWGAVLDGSYRTLAYKVESFDGGLFKVHYGATFIGLTTTREESRCYEEWHKSLMAKYDRSRTVRVVNKLKRRRESVTEAVREELTRFAVDNHIPGKCDYEFCY